MSASSFRRWYVKLITFLIYVENAIIYSHTRCTNLFLSILLLLFSLLYLRILLLFQVRQVVSDFAVIIAIFSMSTLDHFVGIPTPKLEVPTKFKPTLEERGWIISPFQQNPLWSAIIAFLPALLGTILIFMDQQITAVIVNRKENKLKVSETSKYFYLFSSIPYECVKREQCNFACCIFE